MAADNPFAALSLIVAPAILTNACSVLIMSTSNRVARAADRGRELARELEASGNLDNPADTRRLAELNRAEMRSMLLLRALRSAYVALSGFASAALVSLIGAVLVSVADSSITRGFELLAVAAGLIAVSALINASTLLVRESRLAVASLAERSASLRSRARNG
jgi:hypothetical protein